MNRKIAVMTLGVLIGFFLAAGASAASGGAKIKVVAENASVRVQPSQDSEAVEENVALGSVFDSERKIGEWFEVQFKTQLGVDVVCYIHEKYVEVLEGEETAPAGRERAAEVRRASPPPPPRPLPGRTKKLEMLLGGGIGLGTPIDGASNYESQMSNIVMLEYINESGTVSHKAAGPKGLGFSLAYFFAGGFGLSLRADWNLAQKLSGDSRYEVNWKWFTTGAASRSSVWDLTGSLSATPISLNAIYKFRLGGVAPYLNAGVSYFLAKIKVDSVMGYDATWISGIYQYADYFAFPLVVEESLSGVGFNLGAGLDIVLASMIGLTFDVAYFLKGSAEVGWDLVPGSYPSHINAGWTYTLEPGDISRVLENVSMPSLSVKLSFLRILLGIKIFI
ncbi:MAG: hypothetical protein FJY83_04500 [Candidatus Aminicenantes bacterium]|nr:hypothetical protein [Candidatus Aminicenantes bacterium]